MFEIQEAYRRVTTRLSGMPLIVFPQRKRTLKRIYMEIATASQLLVFGVPQKFLCDVLTRKQPHGLVIESGCCCL